ncbi:MAG: peptidoglycan-binding domain-containing protein [Verrucomicrobiae bacterium]
MKKLQPSLIFSRIRRSAALAVVCILGLPLVAQAHDHPVDNAVQSVTGFLRGLGNNIVGRGNRALEPNRPYQYEERRTGYYDQRYARNNSMEAAVQRALARNGYYNGPIDGSIGPMSTQAIANYQADHGLRVTRYPDSSLLNSLGL